MNLGDDREGGFIVILRRIRSSELWKSLTAAQKAVLVVLLLLANWKPSRVRWRTQWYEIRRGELAHTLETIAREARCKVKTVRTTIRVLKTDDGTGPFLVERYPISGTGPGTGPRVLTIVNYDKYQDLAREEGTGPGTAGAWVGHGSGTGRAEREPIEPGGEPSEPEKQTPAPPTASPSSPAGKKGKNGKAPDPRRRPLVDRLVAAFLDVRGVRYAFQEGRDGKAVTTLLALGTDEDIGTRWRRGLELGERWPGCSSLSGLVSKWNDLAPASTTGKLTGFAPAGQFPPGVRQIDLTTERPIDPRGRGAWPSSGNYDEPFK